MCDMTHSYLWHDARVHTRSARLSRRPFATGDLFVICLIQYVQHDPFIYVTWLISYVWHDLLIFVKRRVCANTQRSSIKQTFRSRWLILVTRLNQYVRHNSIICVTWLIHICYLTHSYVWHDSFIFVTRRVRANSLSCLKLAAIVYQGDLYHGDLEWVMSHSQRSYMNESWHTHSARTWLTWLIQGAMTHSRCNDPVIHDSFKVPWLILTWFIQSAMTHSYTSAASVAWLSDMTHSIRETLNESCHTPSARIWMNHGTLAALVHVSRDSFYHGDLEWVMSHSQRLSMNESYTTHSARLSRRHFTTGDMLYSHVWHYSFICVPYVCYDSCERTTRTRLTRRPFGRDDMTYSHLWHHSFIRVTWLICAN